MKRITLSAILAMGIHAYFLWADFDWIGKTTSLKPKPRMITLELVTRPLPAAESVPKPAGPKLPPALALSSEQKPKPKPAPKPIPQQQSKPDPILVPVPEIKAAPLLPEEQIPPQTTPENKPVSESPPAMLTAGEIPGATPSEPRPPTALKTDKNDRPGPIGALEAPPAPVPIREAKPRYRDNPPPPYPILARKRGYQGTVILDVFIDKDGRVADMKLFSSSGYAILDRAARNTVENWLFEPGLQGNEKIEMWVKVPVRFQLK